MKKQFAVIGCGRFGSSIAKVLFDMGHEVLAIDKSEEIVQNIANYVTHAVQADATDENSIKALGIRNFDVAVVTIGSNIQSSILITLMVKEIGVKYVVAKAQNELHAKVLYKIGADRVVFPEREMGVRVAHNLVSSNIMDYIELAPDYSIVEIAALDEWIGKSLIDINMRSKYGINVMAIKHGADINIAPRASDVIMQGDVLVVIGHNDDLRKIEKR
ncbi:trk system potassium uptake protein TrkA [Caminicella sporogenes DSM 14501]|uniref:Trk system potassium uptake protein TrkA n=1 Tax=Caminicella sporogenes DSM 14501 TaxID=1121266 RepID=A0A1M6R3L0_9FIRM|nr:TrkA family potassium uptake protein [Caminicella sporogenes]RKD27295.1 potassium transporter Trk [Caminicella sporogenes]WIF94271.1 TrkA family potassium uptake protein [Caminicella sporogenes]SHK26927.1 trk system potassium uptake protein TrkA [Caminicella sporogenes DSM 14501]